MKCKLNEIVIDQSIYPRSTVNPYFVQRIVHAITAGAIYPPITVEAKTRRVVDGRHRYEAYQRLKLKSINIIAKSYANDGELFADAVRLNIAHGQPLDQFAIRGAILRLNQYGFSREQISAIVRVPGPRLEETKKGLARAGGLDIPLKGGLRHMQGRTLSPEQAEFNKHYAGGNAAFYARQLADMLEHELWPDHSELFFEQMNRLVELWQKIQRSDRSTKRSAS